MTSTIVSTGCSKHGNSKQCSEHRDVKSTGADRIKVLYSVGFGRNGGTLLDRALGEIDGFVSLGELRMVWSKGLINDELCNCGVPFRSCEFWNRVFKRAFGGIEEIDGKEMLNLAETVDKMRYLPHLMSPLRTRQFECRMKEYRQVIRELYKAIHEETGAKVLVDSSRFPGTAMMLDSIPEIQIYVLHLVRDSRASSFSWQRRKRKLEVVGENEYLKQYSPLESSVWWIMRNLGAETLKWRRNYLFMRYEDFVQSPLSSLEKIASFVDEKPVKFPIKGERTIVFGQSHTQSGNPDRFRSGPVEIHADKEWYWKMKRPAKVLVTLLTWPLLLRYGYRISES